jgi:polysaccharide deacetylase family protein (PEP-CTERM system associated)
MLEQHHVPTGHRSGGDQRPNALTIDVEDYFHVSAMERAVARDDWDRMESRVERNTHRVLDILDEHGVLATFFVLGWVAERHPGLVQTIARRGHEVASHGYSHTRIYRQSLEDFRRETVRAKSVLENVVQRPVLGYRAASFSITRVSTWALDVLVDAGFRYDSSIFPVRHDLYGMPDAQRTPHRLVTPAGAQLIEVPLTTLKLGPIQLPIAGGGYFRLFPYRFTAWALRRFVSQTGAPCVFYLHPWELDVDQPRIRNAGRLSRFRHYQNLERCEPRLRRLLAEFRFAPVREVLEGLGLTWGVHDRCAAATG